jgi:hypothetical protein
MIWISRRTSSYVSSFRLAMDFHAEVGRAELPLSYLLELGRVDVMLEDGVHEEARTLDAHALHLGHRLCHRWVVPRLRGRGRLRLVGGSGGVPQFGALSKAGEEGSGRAGIGAEAGCTGRHRLTEARNPLWPTALGPT